MDARSAKPDCIDIPGGRTYCESVMATQVIMPKQGQSVESCIIVGWKKRPGDAVKTGEVICEVETDKATFEVESPAEGTLLAIFHDTGSDVPVLAPIAAIGKPGEPFESLRGSAACACRGSRSRACPRCGCRERACREVRAAHPFRQGHGVPEGESACRGARHFPCRSSGLGSRWPHHRARRGGGRCSPAGCGGAGSRATGSAPGRCCGRACFLCSGRGARGEGHRHQEAHL